MIAKLTGTLDSIQNNQVIVDVNGVGYLVQASGRTLSRIGSAEGSSVCLLIETIVREDAFILYGFCDAHEKEWFQILCGVNGVGAKAALAILSVIDPAQLAVVIAAQDKAMIKRADGVGDKLAMRIVTELKDKAGKMSLGQTATLQAKKAQGSPADTPAAPQGIANDAVSALVNLGYGRAEAYHAVMHIMGNNAESADLSTLIRDSLKELSA